MIYLYNRLLSNKKGQTIQTCNMDASQKHLKCQTPMTIYCMMTDLPIHINKGKTTVTESRLVAAKDQG